MLAPAILLSSSVTQSSGSVRSARFALAVSIAAATSGFLRFQSSQWQKLAAVPQPIRFQRESRPHSTARPAPR
jgi:hypothetical protein